MQSFFWSLQISIICHVHISWSFKNFISAHATSTLTQTVVMLQTSQKFKHVSLEKFNDIHGIFWSNYASLCREWPIYFPHITSGTGYWLIYFHHGSCTLLTDDEFPYFPTKSYVMQSQWPKIYVQHIKALLHKKILWTVRLNGKLHHNISAPP